MAAWRIKPVPDWQVKWKIVGPFTSYTNHFNKTIYLAAHIFALPDSVLYKAVVKHEQEHADQGERFPLGGWFWSICYGAGIPCMFSIPVLLSLAIAHSRLWLIVAWVCALVTFFSRNLRLEEELEAEAAELFERWRILGITDNPEILAKHVSADRLHVFGRPYWMFGVDRAFITHSIVERARKRIKEHLSNGG
jgi:hypothetical protein